MNQLFGKRLCALRKERGLSQEELATLLEFKDRQTISAIETGNRRVTVEEWLLLEELLDVPHEYFADPFMLVGEGSFAWRENGVSTKQLDAYEKRASRWIAAYRELAPEVGREHTFMRQTLCLERNANFEEVAHAGERFAAEFKLGEIPATRLLDTMTERLGILVLMVDTNRGISGAACRLPELDAALIARHETVGRRNFDLAHELFHFLTWDAMPPKCFGQPAHTGGSRTERLANIFASALLMPSEQLKKLGNWASLSKADLIQQLNTVADELHVTSSALRWRLVTLGELNQAAATSLPDAKLRNNGHSDQPADNEPPALFSKPFMEVMAHAMDRGIVSVRRTADLLDLTIEELRDLCATYDVPQPAEL